MRFIWLAVALVFLAMTSPLLADDCSMTMKSAPCADMPHEKPQSDKKMTHECVCCAVSFMRVANMDGTILRPSRVEFSSWIAHLGVGRALVPPLKPPIG